MHTIAGSMRTLAQLREACSLRAVPTIGMRVWDLLLQEEPDTWQDLFRIGPFTVAEHSPLTGAGELELSRSFFREMDGYAAPLHEEWMARNTR